jgi:hypothetical protein
MNHSDGKRKAIPNGLRGMQQDLLHYDTVESNLVPSNTLVVRPIVWRHMRQTVAYP